MRPESIPSYKTYESLGGCQCDPFYMEPEFPNIAFGMDGGVYEFYGMKCLVIGGAYSVDKYYRLRHGRRWFADEQPSQETKDRVESKIAQLDNRVDVVLTHTCPGKYIPTEMFLPGIDQSTVDTSTEEWLDKIEDTLDYKLWLCGHYHTDKSIDKMRFMLNDIVCLEDLLCR